MKHVVSVSIGSSTRDHSVETEILGEKFRVERIGTDGDEKKAVELIRSLDGKVDAIGLGGIDLYLIAGKKRYIIRDAKKLANAAKKTIVLDGSGMKNTLERMIIRDLVAEGKYLRKGSKVLLVSAVDRFGMAETLYEKGCDVIFGDFLFALGLPIPVKSLVSLRILAAILLPIFTRLPFKMLYPTGSEQTHRKPKFQNYFQWAEVIAGDFHFIKRKMPDDLKNKIILTNTVTSKDVEELKTLGASVLITTTPEFEGRSFGTNVFEGICAAMLGKKKDDMPSEEEYIDLIKKMGFGPRISKLN
ncbi:MAG: quinate 5-dehydrogenase [bacterium]